MRREQLDDRFDFEIRYQKDFDGTDDQHRALGFLYDRATNECVAKLNCLGDDWAEAEGTMRENLKCEAARLRGQ